RIQLGRYHADHVAVFIHQRPARIARLHRHADLEIPRIIHRTGQRRDLPLASLGANPCKPMSGKPTVATVPPRFTLRLAAMGSGLKVSSFFILPSAFALSKARSLAAST